MTDRLEGAPSDILWQGSLSLLTDNHRMFGRHKYELQLMFCRLVKRDGCPTLLCYKKQQLGCKPLHSFKVRNFTTNFELPENAVSLCDGNAGVVCLQTSNDIIFLTSETKEKRDEVIRRIAKEVEYMRAVRDRSYYEALPNPGYQNYSLGQGPPDVFPSITDNEAVGNLRSSTNDYTADLSRHYPVPVKTQSQSAPVSESRQKLSSIGEEPAVAGQSNSNNDAPKSYINHEYFQLGGGGRTPAKKSYSVGDLRLKASTADVDRDEGGVHPYAFPKKEPRKEPVKHAATEVSEAEESEDETQGSITTVRNLHSNSSSSSPSAARSTPNKKRWSMAKYIETFRVEQFKESVEIALLRASELNQSTLQLTLINQQIIIAGVSSSLERTFHVADVIQTVNGMHLSSVAYCYGLFTDCADCEVLLKIQRVPSGVLCNVTMPGNGRIDSLGLSFNKYQGVEVTRIDENGLVAKSGHLPLTRKKARGVINKKASVNWGLIEINQTPVPLGSSAETVKQQLIEAGCDLALIFVPMDLVHVLHSSLSPSDNAVLV